jgi:hypothetical protein
MQASTKSNAQLHTVRCRFARHSATSVGAAQQAAPHVEQLRERLPVRVAREQRVRLVRDHVPHPLRELLRRPPAAVRAAGLAQEARERGGRADDEVERRARRR